MGQIIKGPQQVGEELTATVTECSEVRGKFGPQVRFGLENGDTLFLPAESAARQLIRCGFDTGTQPPKADYEAVGGNTLTWSREDNPNGKPYWAIRVADGLEKAGKPKPKRMTHQEALSPASDAKLRHDQAVPLPETPYDDVRPANGQPSRSADLLRYPSCFEDYMGLMERVAGKMAQIADQKALPQPEWSAIQAATFSIFKHG